MVSGQYQAHRKQPVYQTRLNHVFSAAVTPTVVAAGSFPSVGSKIALSAAQSAKALDWDGKNSLLVGSITLDDANDRINLDPGVYEVEVSLLLLEAGTDSDFGVALTLAAAAAPDLELDAVLGGVLLTGSTAHFHTKKLLTVTAARVLELHVAWHTAGATGTIRPGSFLSIRRLGNIDF